MIEVREVLRGWLGGAGLRTAAERAGVDRKTARRYVQAAQAAGLERSAGLDAVDDELVGAVVAAVRPARPNGHGAAWEALLAREEQIRSWVAGDGKDAKALTIVKIEELLARSGCVVPYRTLHRFATERCGYRAKDTTVRVNDGEPGSECQIDFGHMGYLTDPETGKRRKVHALIFTAVYSRHMFVWLTYSQTLAAVIAGCEAAWAFFGGVFKVLIPDNLKPVVTDADAVNPRLSTGWLDYAQHAGFVTDPARVRSPKDKPRVERAVQYVRGNFWAGESFTDLVDAQERVAAWCTHRAGMRIHGTIQARPLQVFTRRRGRRAAGGPWRLRRADLHPGEGPPRLPRRGGQVVVLHPWGVSGPVPRRPRRQATGPVDPVGADLTKILRALKLGGLKDTLPERLALARQSKMGHAAFLELLLSDEITRRESRSAMLRAAKAGLDPTMRIETWDEPADPSYDRTLFSDLTSLRFAEAGTGVLILGPVGVGKTHLATALGHTAIRRRHSVVSARADKLFTRLRAARLDNTHEAEMRRITAVDILIIDDFALRPLDATQTNDFYELVVEQHRKAPTIWVSNREPSEWLSMTTDALLTQSAVDRLTSGAHTLIVEGPSYRQRDNHPPRVAVDEQRQARDAQ